MKQEILALQQLMKTQNLDAYLIPTSDFHQSEYISDHFKERAYFSGFTGSAGTLVVLQDEALLWTDGRYFIQAEQELSGSGIRLMKMGEEGVLSVNDFLAEALTLEQKLAFDGRLVSATQALSMEQKLPTVTLCWDRDWVDDLWKQRPELPQRPAWLLDECYCGKSREEKLAQVRQEMERHQADGHLLTALDDIAWLLNLRGGDVTDTPVCLCYLYLSMDEGWLYIAPEALGEQEQQALQQAQIHIRPYGDIYDDLPRHTVEKNVLLDPDSVNYSLYCKVTGTVCGATNPERYQKSIKNPVEIRNLRECHRKDGVAVTRFMLWLKKNVGKIPMTERSAEAYLEQCRNEQSHYLCPSFRTIAAYEAHGAMMHYAATEQSDATLHPSGFLLVDSGGQYLEGTTDVTRTFLLGEVSERAKCHYTTVVRSMLRLASARFLYGCRGENLDILAREPLWQLGLDYKCGTGHGVGYLLNVHEGPNSFRWRITNPDRLSTVLEEGMVTTDEPGVYLEGEYGIRIENELLCCKDEKNEYGQFMRFQPLTLVPIDLEGLLPEQMTQEELTALNQYHELVFEMLSPNFDGEDLQLLRYYTRPVFGK